MPVHFKGSSEYKTHYKWMESFRSKGFEAKDERAAPSAGQATVSSSITMEPPLQGKKRLDGPATSLSTNYFSVPSKEVEYTLLGSQDKFASNVRYQAKPSYSTEKIYKNKENFDDVPPPSKQLKMQKRLKPQFKGRHPPVSRSPPRQETRASIELSPPPAPRQVKEALKDKDLKAVLGDEAPAAKAKTVSVTEEGRGNNMNEFVQTDLKKGVTLSGSEAPAEYSLKYKAGVAPPRPAKKFSEYQRQFQWKDGIKASPLLAAEQIVYKSNAELGPYKNDAIPKMSEYNLQFQKWKLPDYMADINFNADDKKSVDEEVQKQVKKKMKRSKSAGAVSHQKAETSVQAAAEESSSEEKLKEKLTKSHGKIKKHETAYKAMFKSPLRYSYAEGTDLNVNNNNNAAEEVPLSNWFAEVVELRRRAQEYRKRAQGTHFSREHLVQLMAQQNDCWDLRSVASSTVNALDLDAPAAGLRSEKCSSPPSSAPPVEDLSHAAIEGDSPQMSDFEEVLEEVEPVEALEPVEVEKKKGTKKRKGGKTRKSRQMAWLEESQEKVAEQRRQIDTIRQIEDDVSESLADQEGGRLPTPVLQGETSARRHHLDLTTPAIGGAILTCPPSKSSHMIVTSRSGDSYVTASDDFPAQPEKKKYNMDALVTLPAGGKVFRDTHALRDETAESDRPLSTQYIMSPPLPAQDDDKENKGQKPIIRKAKKPSNLSTVKEGQGKTYLNLDDIKASTGCQQDDDVMSVSMMSVASSASLASDVLERAKKRTEFWNKK